MFCVRASEDESWLWQSSAGVSRETDLTDPCWRKPVLHQSSQQPQDEEHHSPQLQVTVALTFTPATDFRLTFTFRRAVFIGIQVVFYDSIQVYLYSAFHDTNHCKAALQKIVSFYIIFRSRLLVVIMAEMYSKNHADITNYTQSNRWWALLTAMIICCD